MRVLNGYSGLPEDSRGCVIALGNFDGVHTGHRSVLSQTRALADEIGAPLGVALFDPHPRRFFAPESRAFRLMSEARRNAALEALGVSQLHVLPFDAKMAQMTPEIFVNSVLEAGLGVRGIVTGTDFRFGAGRAGTTTDLETLCAARDIRASFTTLTGNGADKISSTRIRKAIHDGNMEAAAELLGSRWTIDGQVQRGDQRGRTIGFPTANIDLADYVRPAYGVYAVRVGIDGATPERPAVVNFGKRPTVDGLTELLEAHLLGFEGDLYDKAVAVEFHDFIRPEQKFRGLDALKAQIGRDVETAAQMLGVWTGPVTPALLHATHGPHFSVHTRSRAVLDGLQRANYRPGPLGVMQAVPGHCPDAEPYAYSNRKDPIR